MIVVSASLLLSVAFVLSQSSTVTVTPVNNTTVPERDHVALAGNGWVNEYDGALVFQCPEGQYISKMHSIHSNAYEDRRWAYDCKRGFVSNDCYWTGLLNSWDNEMNHEESKAAIVGFESHHDDRFEDREWKFKYCRFLDPENAKCRSRSWTGWINDYDGELSYEVPMDSIMTGAISKHQNSYEDRIWRISVCEMAQCEVTGMTVDKTIKAKYVGTEVAGIQRGLYCDAGKQYTFKFTKGTTISKTSITTTTKSFHWNFGLSIGVSTTVGITAGIPGIESIKAETTVGWTASTNIGQTTTKTNSESDTLTDLTSHGGDMPLTAPVGVMLVVTIRKFEYEDEDVPVTYKLQCDNGNVFEKKGTIKIKGHSYNDVYIRPLSKTPDHTLNQTWCDRTLGTCLENIEASASLSDYDKILDQFYKCFTVDGQWGTWSQWSTCSMTCGGGSRVRKRDCNNPTPADGGKECEGSNENLEECNKAPCPPNGNGNVAVQNGTINGLYALLQLLKQVVAANVPNV